MHVNPVSVEPRVGDVLQKVIAGEADASVIYSSTAISASAAITAVPFPEASSVIVTYPIAILKHAKNRFAANAFIESLVGQTGQDILSTAGFGKP